MGGMITSSTNEVTIFPNAAPMITPTARSMTLPLTANSLNSFSIASSCYSGWSRDPPSPKLLDSFRTEFLIPQQVEHRRHEITVLVDGEVDPQTRAAALLSGRIQAD